MRKLIDLLLLMCLTFSQVQAQPLLSLSSQTTKYNLSDCSDIFTDKSHTLSFDQIRKSGAFQPNQANAFNYGYTPHRHWIRFRFQNKVQQNRWILSVRGSLIDEIELYLVGDEGYFSHKVSGDNYPFSQREVINPMFGFMLNVPEYQSITAYLSVQSHDPIQFTLAIQEASDYARKTNNESRMWFFYFGMMFMIAFYNLLLFVSIRDIGILYYVLYITFFTLLQATMLGYGTMFLWNNSPWFANRAPLLWLGLTVIFSTLFARNFLNIRQFYPKQIVTFRLFAFFGAFIALTNLIQPSLWLHRFAAIVVVFNTLLVFFMGFLVWRQGYRPARFYLIGWSGLLLAILVFVLKTADVLPLNHFTFLGVPITAVLEAILLSLGIGDRINTAQQEKIKAQKLLLQQTLDNERVRANIARDLHDDLGSTVSSIAILSQFAQNQGKQNPEQIPELLARISENARKMQETMQDIVWTNQPEHDSIGDLVVQMRRFGGEILESQNIDFQFNIEDSLLQTKLPPNTQYDFFMVFKEAINNAAKYSKANGVKVNLWRANRTVGMKITDNGIGFDTEKESDGNGLRNMPKRAKNVGGKWSIHSVLNEGTTIHLELPI